ncbi:MAG: hypothetical protein N3A38_04070 [Planctomycetota bacterium]|nr:hypothetical protein [Planctomycetota bacterium]
MRSAISFAVALGLAAPAMSFAGEPAGPAAIAVPAGETTLVENRWTKIAEVPADPLGRELDPGRGAFWCFEPSSGVFLRYGGYTPTECNALWSFELASRRWENLLPVDYSWPPPPDRPGAGAWWSMAWDSKRKAVWLCGGVGVASRKHPELFNDIWQYDPARKTFSPAKSKAFPAFSGGCRIVYDSKNDLIIRAPAYDGEWAAMCNRDATWIYDPNKNTWEGRKTPGSPKNALCAAFVFDASAGKAVYLAQGKDHRAETWTYDAAANAWAKVETAERPPARVVAGAAYDPENKLIVICGGVGHRGGDGYGYLHRGGGVQLTDTWALDLSKPEWRKLDVGAPAVPKLNGERGTRFEHFCAMDYDSKNKALVLSAPTVGVWALRYRPEGAKAQPELKLTALPPARKIEPPKEPVFRMAPPNRKLLELPPNTWTKLDGGPCIGGGEVPMIYDEATGFCLKYGGCNNGGAGSFSSGYGNDLSAYDPATERWIALRWVDPCGPARPANGCTRGYCYDPVRKVVWFAGGTAGNSLAWSLPPDFQGSFDNATWRYDSLRDRFDLVPSKGRTPHGWDRVVCCYDRERNLFVFNARLFDPAEATWADGGEGLPVMMYTYACYASTLKGLFAVRRDKAQEGIWNHKAVLYSASEKAWKDLPAATGLPQGKDARAMTAYDPGNDIVVCVLGGQTFIYDIKAGTWKDPGIKAPDVAEHMVFDTRHKVVLATGAMGKHMWAFRCGKEGN